MSENESATKKITISRFHEGREQWTVEWDGARITVGKGEWGPVVVAPDLASALVDDILTIMGEMVK